MSRYKLYALRKNSYVTLCWKCQIFSFQPAPTLIAPCSCAQTTRLLSHAYTSSTAQPAQPAQPAEHSQPGLVLNFLLGRAENPQSSRPESQLRRKYGSRQTCRLYITFYTEKHTMHLLNQRCLDLGIYWVIQKGCPQSGGCKLGIFRSS